jgi:hypothetical protein
MVLHAYKLSWSNQPYACIRRCSNCFTRSLWGPQVWQLADLGVSHGRTSAPEESHRLSRIVEEREESDVAEEQGEVTAGAALAIFLGMEAAGSSFLLGLDPGMIVGIGSLIGTGMIWVGISTDRVGTPKEG